MEEKTRKKRAPVCPVCGSNERVDRIWRYDEKYFADKAWLCFKCNRRFDERKTGALLDRVYERMEYRRYH